MPALATDADPAAATGLYRVYTASERFHRVAAPGITREGAWTGECPDWTFNEPARGCYHVRKARYLVDIGVVPRADEEIAEPFRNTLADTAAQLDALGARARSDADLDVDVSGVAYLQDAVERALDGRL